MTWKYGTDAWKYADGSNGPFRTGRYIPHARVISTGTIWSSLWELESEGGIWKRYTETSRICKGNSLLPILFYWLLAVDMSSKNGLLQLQVAFYRGAGVRRVLGSIIHLSQSQGPVAQIRGTLLVERLRPCPTSGLKRGNTKRAVVRRWRIWWGIELISWCKRITLAICLEIFYRHDGAHVKESYHLLHGGLPRSNAYEGFAVPMINTSRYHWYERGNRFGLILVVSGGKAAGLAFLGAANWI